MKALIAVLMAAILNFGEANAMQTEKVNPENELSFVLLHGAGLGSWIWDRVVSQLKMPALAIDLPGRASRPADFTKLSLSDITRSVIEEINTEELGRIILVAHSVSGPLALDIASKIPNKIVSVVFVGAGIPDSGSGYIDILPRESQDLLRDLVKQYPEGLKAPDFVLRNALCNDLSQGDADSVVSRVVPEAPRLFVDKVEWHQPRRAVYVQLMKDQSDLSPELQGELAGKLHSAKVIGLEAGHLPMIGRPYQIAEILNSEAEGLPKTGTSLI